MRSSNNRAWIAQFSTMKQHGFTPVELMVAICILAICLMLAIPAMRSIVANNQVVTASNSILTGYSLARSEAISRGNTVVICPSYNGNKCNKGRWNRGWIIFDDADGNGKYANSEVIRRYYSQSNLKRSGLSGNISFQPDGTTTLGSSTSLTICHKDSHATDMCRKILINRFGLITSEEVTT